MLGKLLYSVEHFWLLGMGMLGIVCNILGLILHAGWWTGGYNGYFAYPATHYWYNPWIPGEEYVYRYILAYVWGILIYPFHKLNWNSGTVVSDYVSVQSLLFIPPVLHLIWAVTIVFTIKDVKAWDEVTSDERLKTSVEDKKNAKKARIGLICSLCCIVLEMWIFSTVRNDRGFGCSTYFHMEKLGKDGAIAPWVVNLIDRREINKMYGCGLRISQDFLQNEGGSFPSEMNSSVRSEVKSFLAPGEEAYPPKLDGVRAVKASRAAKAALKRMGQVESSNGPTRATDISLMAGNAIHEGENETTKSEETDKVSLKTTDIATGLNSYGGYDDRMEPRFQHGFTTRRRDPQFALGSFRFFCLCCILLSIVTVGMTISALVKIQVAYSVRYRNRNGKKHEKRESDIAPYFSKCFYNAKGHAGTRMLQNARSEPIGMPNWTGNACYMNSLFQLLIHAPWYWRPYLIEESNRGRACRLLHKAYTHLQTLGKTEIGAATGQNNIAAGKICLSSKAEFMVFLKAMTGTTDDGLEPLPRYEQNDIHEVLLRDPPWNQHVKNRATVPLITCERTFTKLRPFDDVRTRLEPVDDEDNDAVSSTSEDQNLEKAITTKNMNNNGSPTVRDADLDIVVDPTNDRAQMQATSEDMFHNTDSKSSFRLSYDEDTESATKLTVRLKESPSAVAQLHYNCGPEILGEVSATHKSEQIKAFDLVQETEIFYIEPISRKAGNSYDPLDATDANFLEQHNIGILLSFTPYSDMNRKLSKEKRVQFVGPRFRLVSNAVHGQGALDIRYRLTGKQPNLRLDGFSIHVGNSSLRSGHYLTFIRRGVTKEDTKQRKKQQDWNNRYDVDAPEAIVSEAGAPVAEASKAGAHGIAASGVSSLQDNLEDLRTWQHESEDWQNFSQWYRCNDNKVDAVSEEVVVSRLPDGVLFYYTILDDAENFVVKNEQCAKTADIRHGA